jgi:hypothetical protein
VRVGEQSKTDFTKGELMALLFMKNRYHEKLFETQSGKFLYKEGRAYFRIPGLKYKGKKITVAVPIRSNINKNFQKNRDEYVATQPTEHTEVGNYAGWHFIKMIPFSAI